MRRLKTQYVISAAAITFVGLQPTVAFAEDSTATLTNPADKLEEITVTANKVTGNLQNTSVAISVLNGQSLDALHISNSSELDRQVPGMTIAVAGNYPANVTIRGVGFDGLQNASSQPGVSLNQNGVYLASPAGLFTDFLDVSQVEVLRGPQGTVLGQNSDGGAINITTTLPDSHAASASADASYGSYNYFRGRGVINLPVSDTFAVRAAIQRFQDDGWMKSPNVPGHSHQGAEDDWAARVTALWTPTDALSVNVWGEYFYGRTSGPAAKNVIDPDTNPRETSNDYYEPRLTLSKIVAGTIAYNFSGFTAKSITSYQDVKSEAPFSGDQLSFPEAVAIYGVKDELAVSSTIPKTFTQELDVSSKPGGRLSWIVGAFYLRTTTYGPVFEVQQTTPIAYTPNFAPTPAQLGALYAAGLNFESVSNQVHRSASVYGQSSFAITGKLKLSGGFRYTWDKSTAETSPYYRPNAHLGTEFNGLTGKFALDYQITEHSLIYALFSTGVKPGGTNLNPGATVVPTAFKNELVKAYELGSKNEFFEHKIRLNISAFYNDYYNLQTPSEDPDPYLGGMENVAKSDVYGVEAETTIILPYGFRIDANISAMDSKVDSDSIALDPYVAHAIDRADGIYTPADLSGRAAAFEDLKGHQLGRVPRFSSALSIENMLVISGVGTLDTRVQGTHRSSFYDRIFNNPRTDRVPASTLFNLNAKLKIRDSRWYVGIDIVNVTNKTIVNSRYAENFGVGAIFETFTPPRQFIGRIGVAF